MSVFSEAAIAELGDHICKEIEFVLQKAKSISKEDRADIVSRKHVRQAIDQLRAHPRTSKFSKICGLIGSLLSGCALQFFATPGIENQSFVSIAIAATLLGLGTFAAAWHIGKD
ncbi:hypothetical protein GCM10011487_56900 [Steroidobacter agaridevorans]|uniref:Uncharacterized protein n=1 Tax=Steroidobacter agaridevorans TaxID=2695856 RepID=A0A829YKB8_9GAMM|nr:hypothetical protein [Steroidobacter agaridevorans]GFE83690.1 hypothetical protein GCM10011487_56900 [Steroidobacter agaridevorans]